MREAAQASKRLFVVLCRSSVRDRLDIIGAVTAAVLRRTPHGKRIAVAGLVLLRQRPSTAKGVTFVTLEDEIGTMNLVLFQNIWERFYSIAKRASAWIAHGHVQREGDVIHVVVQRLEDLGERAGTVKVASRNFR